MKNSNSTTNTTMNNVKEENNMKTANLYVTNFKRGLAGAATILDEDGNETVLTTEANATDTMPVIQLKLIIEAAKEMHDTYIEAFVPCSYIGTVNKDMAMGWVRSGYRNKNGDPLAHKNLWKDLFGTLRANGDRINFHVWFRGDVPVDDANVAVEQTELEEVF